MLVRRLSFYVRRYIVFALFLAVALTAAISSRCERQGGAASAPPADKSDRLYLTCGIKNRLIAPKSLLFPLPDAPWGSYGKGGNLEIQDAYLYSFYGSHSRTDRFAAHGRP